MPEGVEHENMRKALNDMSIEPLMPDGVEQYHGWLKLIYRAGGRTLRCRKALSTFGRRRTESSGRRVGASDAERRSALLHAVEDRWVVLVLRPLMPKGVEHSQPEYSDTFFLCRSL